MKRWRHFIVVIGTIPSLLVYIILCMVLFEYVTGFYWLLDWLIYIISGLVWIYPAAKIIKWLADNEAH
ncbi:MAG: DUF2842 domain-containing protein [Proteobacteria bacterium]|nr:DUF2842 domain-containing protein [Pseudomonadota bacterium]MDA1134704.1 DUF2842 domain-containing protein [Pseudomonadota bacterium]